MCETFRLINVMKFMGLKALEATSLWSKSIFYFYRVLNKSNLSRPGSRGQRLKLSRFCFNVTETEGLFSPELLILPENNAFEIFIYVSMLPFPTPPSTREIVRFYEEKINAGFSISWWEKNLLSPGRKTERTCMFKAEELGGNGDLEEKQISLVATWIFTEEQIEHVLFLYCSMMKFGAICSSSMLLAPIQLHSSK